MRIARTVAVTFVTWSVALAPSPLAAEPRVDVGPRQRDAARASGGGHVWLGPKPPDVPRRVVTLAPSLTDIVVELGLAGRIAGVTRYDDAPEAKDLPRVGGFLDPNVEAIVGLRPDLVLWMTDGGALAAVERLASLRVPVLALPIVSVADVYAAARTVGGALGDPDGGERLARRLEADVERVRSRAAGLRPVRALFVVGRDPLVVAGPGSYPDEVMRLAGAVNVASGSRPWPVYPVEKAIADDPEVVIDGAVLEPPEGLARLAAVPAVRSGRVHRLKNDAALRPGPRLPAALEELADALRRNTEPR